MHRQNEGRDMTTDAATRKFTTQEVVDFYFDWPAKNTGVAREDLTLDSKWVGDVGESADLDTLRDDIDAFCGVLASDEEAKANNTIGKAIDTTCRLLKERGR